MSRILSVKQDHGLLRNYVDGEWLESSATRQHPVTDPGTGKLLGQVPLSPKSEVDEAVAAAKAAFWEWRTTPPQTRARYMYKLKALLEENFEELARLNTLDHGKGIDESRGSVRRLIDNVEVAAGIPSMMMGYGLEDGAAAGIDEEVILQPLGVFTAICPYNFPAMVPFWFIPSALACGNTFVLKPSEQVPLVQNRIFELIDDELDLPPGVLNMVHGDKEAVDALLYNPDVVGVSFVGSSPVAQYIYETGAKQGKRVQAQGGAKNTIVVADDADLDQTIPNMIASFYGCAGQRCLAGSVLMPIGDAY
ncbi:MAG: aldehyde dehydrogenase family protein, partial [Myxococcales bacterium]|nr:aldehyde dehydrogenase family protein [Myxococcales bacterium]